MPVVFSRQNSVQTSPKLVLRGTFIDAPTPRAIRVHKETEIMVDTGSGTISYITEGRDGWRNWEDFEEGVEVFEIPDHCAVIPGFVDCHVHAPQYTQLGTKTDIPLMQWLNNYTFPTESAFSSPTHAAKIYEALIRRLLMNGTTTATYYSSNHQSSTRILATLCKKYGQRALVGKTCSDQLVPDYYVEDTQKSLQDTEEFVTWCYAEFGEEGLVQPVITPRFVPTCSLGLLRGLGDLAEKYHVHIQTHAAESVDEVALVASQHPETPRDVQILASTGLLNEKTILAHCCHLSSQEASELAAAGTSIASCPYSNILFAQAVLPVDRFRNMGVKIGLGTDIAGGHKPGMVSAMQTAILADRILDFPPVNRVREKVVDWKYAFHLATAGGGQALGLPIGDFAVGMKWDALCVNLSWEDELEEFSSDEEGRFERWMCCFGGEREVEQVWVDGILVLNTEKY